VSVDHSPVQNDESELAIISISGPGMKFGNLQVVWALQKIRFAFPALLQERNSNAEFYWYPPPPRLTALQYVIEKWEPGQWEPS